MVFITKEQAAKRKRALLILLLRRRRQAYQRKLYIRNLFLNRATGGTFGEYGLSEDLEKDPTYFYRYYRLVEVSINRAIRP